MAYRLARISVKLMTNTMVVPLILVLTVADTSSTTIQSKTDNIPILRRQIIESPRPKVLHEWQT